MAEFLIFNDKIRAIADRAIADIKSDALRELVNRFPPNRLYNARETGPLPVQVAGFMEELTHVVVAVCDHCCPIKMAKYPYAFKVAVDGLVEVDLPDGVEPIRADDRDVTMVPKVDDMVSVVQVAAKPPVADPAPPTGPFKFRAKGGTA